MMVYLIAPCLYCVVFPVDVWQNGGGVFIALHDKFTTSTVENSENDCELQ
jgi:hypothetical protein